jgi:micrococcal nuclease
MRLPRSAPLIAISAFALAGLWALLHSATTPSRSIPASARGVIVRVVDGDTVVVAVAGHHETVRLIGIDTPETVKPNHPVDCYGPQASARTKSLLPPRTAVIIEQDREARDRYGRLLAYVTRASDGLFVNLELADGGYARALPITPNTAHAETFAAAVAGAQGQRLGLWGACAYFGAPANGAG